MQVKVERCRKKARRNSEKEGYQAAEFVFIYITDLYRQISGGQSPEGLFGVGPLFDYQFSFVLLLSSYITGLHNLACWLREEVDLLGGAGKGYALLLFSILK